MVKSGWEVSKHTWKVKSIDGESTYGDTKSKGEEAFGTGDLNLAKPG